MKSIANVEVVLNIPSPYRLHLLEAMSKLLFSKKIGMHVDFMARGHSERPKAWMNPTINFPHRYWRDYGLRYHHFNPGLIINLFRRENDVLMTGTPFDTFTGIFIALFVKARIKICWIEGNTKTPGRMNGLYGWFKRFILARFDYAAVPGLDGANYFALHQSKTKMKMPKPIFLPNLVDESLFKPRGMWPATEIVKMRASFGCDATKKLCLIPARLNPVKGLVPFIDLLTPLMLADWKVVIIGQGPLKDEILSRINARGLSQSIVVMDYVPYESMPLIYASSDLLLLPSHHDPNPLSVPEALHSGLPVALSNVLGNVEEGVTDGVNGWVLPVFDKARYLEVLKRVFSADKEGLKKKGAISLARHAKFWDTQMALTKFLQSISVEEPI